MNEIVDLLADIDDESIPDIYIEPPDARLLTDEDSNDENDSTNNDLARLSGRQLRAPAHKREQACNVDNSDDETNKRPAKKKKKTENFCC